MLRRAVPALLLAVLAAPLPALVPARALPWRNIGPANMAGRVTAIEAVEANPAIVYAGAASGGVWKSLNGGTTWSAIFTHYGTANVGDIAIFQPNPDIVWVGTGESCVRNSVGDALAALHKGLGGLEEHDRLFALSELSYAYARKRHDQSYF